MSNNLGATVSSIKSHEKMNKYDAVKDNFGI